MLDGAHYVSRIAEQEGKDAFFTDIKTQRAILYTLQTMSEASKGLSETTKAAEGDIPWAKVRNFRNVLVHEYFRVDLNTVWEVIENDLPPLIEALGRMEAQYRAAMK